MKWVYFLPVNSIFNPERSLSMPEQPSSPFPPLQTDLKIHSCLMSSLRLPRTYIRMDFDESRQDQWKIHFCSSYFCCFLLKTKGYTKAPLGKSAGIEGISQTKDLPRFSNLFKILFWHLRADFLLIKGIIAEKWRSKFHQNQMMCLSQTFLPIWSCFNASK